MKGLLDNDVLQKGLRYDLICPLLSTTELSTTEAGVLGSARFVLSDLIRRLQPPSESENVGRRLEEFLREAQIIEPTQQEVELSAALELLAQVHSQPLDTGESQLCAVLVSRNVPILLTGDKRAVVSLEVLLDHDSRLKPVTGRVRSLEQLVNRLLDVVEFSFIRGPICSRDGVDKALTICFACGSDDATKETVRAGLESYINDLKKSAPRILAS
jgi:hypothetical protein